MNDNMQPFVMNLILYSTYLYEMLMVTTSFLASLLPFILILGLILTRKPDFVRALIVYFSAKLSFFAFSETSYYFSKERFYICSMERNVLSENMGLCE